MFVELEVYQSDAINTVLPYKDVTLANGIASGFRADGSSYDFACLHAFKLAPGYDIDFELDVAFTLSEKSVHSDNKASYLSSPKLVI